MRTENSDGAISPNSVFLFHPVGPALDSKTGLSQ
jgi:hypothetical protein